MSTLLLRTAITSASASPRLAASVILVAPSSASKIGESNYRVLMMKRAKTLKFMPGVHVFPGGAIDPVDKDERWSQLLGSEKPSDSLAERIGAVRETFEECGILLATPEERATQIPSDELKQWRADQVLKDGTKFFQLFEHFKLRPAVNKLIDWSTWITPVFEPRRFYTRFFLAVLPHLRTDAVHEENESVSTEWLRPEEAVSLYTQQKIKLIPPQWYTMNELSGCKDILQIPSLRPPNFKMVPIQPNFTQDEQGNPLSALPGDPLHPDGAKAPHHRHRLLFENRQGFMGMRLEKVLDEASSPTSKL